MATKRAADEQATGYNPLHRYKWFEYLEEELEEGEIPIRLRIRTNLTYGELEALSWDDEEITSDRDLWPRFAPLVVDWNLVGVDDDGNTVKLSPPAEGGPEQFEHVPPQLFGAIVRDIRFRGNAPFGPEDAAAVRAHARYARKRQLEGVDIDVPPFPPHLWHYWRMKVDALTPNEYWNTAAEDYERAVAVQDAVREGWRDADEDHKARQDAG